MNAFLSEPPSGAVQGAAPGRLSSKQAELVRNHIEIRLNETIMVRGLAALVGLSYHHFSRAFSKTFGEPPHAYVMRRRIACAQELMLASGTPLAHIAVDCGLVDQAHFTRLFRKFTGESPAAWRRGRVVGSMSP